MTHEEIEKIVAEVSETAKKRGVIMEHRGGQYGHLIIRRKSDWKAIRFWAATGTVLTPENEKYHGMKMLWISAEK